MLFSKNNQFKNIVGKTNGFWYPDRLKFHIQASSHHKNRKIISQGTSSSESKNDKTPTIQIPPIWNHMFHVQYNQPHKWQTFSCYAFKYYNSFLKCEVTHKSVFKKSSCSYSLWKCPQGCKSSSILNNFLKALYLTKRKTCCSWKRQIAILSVEYFWTKRKY